MGDERDRAFEALRLLGLNPDRAMQELADAAPRVAEGSTALEWFHAVSGPQCIRLERLLAEQGADHG